MKRRAFIVGLGAGLSIDPVAHVALAGTDIPRVAFFGFQLINTSVQPCAAPPV
jgi:hypothetical protein